MRGELEPTEARRIPGKEVWAMTTRGKVSSDWLAYLFWLVVAWAMGLGSVAITVLRGQ
jgi:hypothetical protein